MKGKKEPQPQYIAPANKLRRITLAPGCTAALTDRGKYWPEEIESDKDQSYNKGLQDGIRTEQLRRETMEQNQAAPSENEIIDKGILLAKALTPEGRNSMLAILIQSIDIWTTNATEHARKVADNAASEHEVATEDRDNFKKLLETSGKYNFNG